MSHSITRFISLLLLLFIVLLSLSCRPSIDKKALTVKKVLNGNTVEFSDGYRLILAGVTNTSTSQAFLEEKVLNKKVKIFLDKKNYNPKKKGSKEFLGYIIGLDKSNINRDLIKYGFAELQTDYDYDSLSAYAHITTSPYLADVLPKSTSNTNDKFSLKSVVAQSEPSVFLVYSLDNSGDIIGQGTGFFIGDNNIGVSNYHVFEKGSNWVIKASDKNTYEVSKIIKKNRDYDYVTFKVNANQKFPFLRTSTILPEKGEDIIVIGNPRGLENTVTRGIVSGFRDKIIRNSIIQIDASISPGSSGSPVLNMRGEVIGIATMKLEDCENCNFAFSILVIDGQ